VEKPPESTICGKNVSDGIVVASSNAGIPVIKRSGVGLSLYRTRRPATEIELPGGAEIQAIPLNGVEGFTPGIFPIKLVTCPRGGTETGVDAIAMVPSTFVNSILTFTAEFPEFEIAKKVCADPASRAAKFPESSAKSRKAFVVGVATIVVSLIVTLLALSLNTLATEGVCVLPDGTISIQPVAVVAADPAVRIRREVLAGIE
jgi:hypothetical protein